MKISVKNKNLISKTQPRFRVSALSYAVLMASLCIYQASAYAADKTTNEETKTLATISLQAQGNWLDEANVQKVHEHAGARTIIDRNQLDEKATTSIRDALKHVPGVQVQENNGTGGSDLSLNMGVRGLTSRLSPRSTMLIDGVPLSFAPYGQPQLSLAPTSMGNIESVDVVRGAGSVRFGPQNVGGIINFATRAIPKDFGGSVGLTTEFTSGTDQLKYKPNVFIGGTTNNGFGAALLYSATQGDAYREANNDIDIEDILLKTAYEITDQDKIALNLHHYDGRGEIPEGLTKAKYAKNPYQSNVSRSFFVGRRTDASLKYSHKDEKNDFEVLGYYVKTFRSSDLENVLNATNSRLDTSPRDYKFWGIEPRYSRIYSFGDVNNEITVGYRYLEENSKEFSGRTANFNTQNGVVGPFIPRTSSQGGTTAHAIYIDNRFEMGPWSITPGLRFESIKSNNDFTAYINGVAVNTVNPKIKSDEFLPNLAVNYSVNDQWNIFANAGVSFGPLQYNQLAAVNTNSNLAISTIGGLQPEKSNNYEIGTKYLGNGLRAELTLFYLDFDKELIQERDAFANAIWTNLGTTSHKGVETGLSYDFGSMFDSLAGLKVYGNYTYTKAVAEAGNFKGKDLPLYSNHVANLGFGYQYNAWSINTDMYAQSKQHVPGNQDSNVYVTRASADGKLGDIQGYSTFAVRAGYDFGKRLSGLKVAGGIKNLFDRDYFTRSSDATGGKFAGQPRTFFLQTSVNF